MVPSKSHHSGRPAREGSASDKSQHDDPISNSKVLKKHVFKHVAMSIQEPVLSTCLFCPSMTELQSQRYLCQRATVWHTYPPTEYGTCSLG